MCVKIFVTMMNTTNNHLKTSDQVSDETNIANTIDDINYVQQANADCFVINVICFSCMIIGLFCLLSYEPNLNPNVNSNENPFFNKSNITGILNPVNKSINFSVSIVN